MASALRWVASVQALGAAVLVLGARVPRPCCGPDQWEAVSFLQNAAYMETGNRATYQNSINQMSYDYTAKKVALETHVLGDNSTVTHTYKVIEDFNQKALWVVQGMTCIKQALHLNMTLPCVPDTAVLLGKHVYGGVEATTWVSRADNMTSRVTVSNDGCYALATTSVSTGLVWRLVVQNFQNITEGIKDPRVFDLPPSCHPKASVMDL